MGLSGGGGGRAVRCADCMPSCRRESAGVVREVSLERLIIGAYIDTIIDVKLGEKTLEQMRREPANVRFGALLRVCETYFGKPRQQGSSHAIFKTPWPGDPRVNIQNDKGKAKAYQVRQVLLAIEKLEKKI